MLRKCGAETVAAPLAKVKYPGVNFLREALEVAKCEAHTFVSCLSWVEAAFHFNGGHNGATGEIQGISFAGILRGRASS